MKLTKISLIIVMSLVGITMGVTALAAGGNIEGSNPSSIELFSMVVKMAGKELTIDAPRISPGDEDHGVVTILVKNSGSEPIALAKIEIIYWNQFPQLESDWSEQVQLKDLAPGEVQTIVYNAHWSWEKGSLPGKGCKYRIASASMLRWYRVCSVKAGLKLTHLLAF